MTDVRDPESMIEAAQKAVSDGDYPAAERLLQEAAAMQQASLGASHPDLASTLNNLAFVCERTNKFDEAERGYRRAHAIAVASLSPGHPLIVTSLKNLVEFCAARGIPIWTPPAAPIEDEPLPDDTDVEPLPEA
jgi:tetratricopeptide (TPR) repeat protein